MRKVAAKQASLKATDSKPSKDKLPIDVPVMQFEEKKRTKVIEEHLVIEDTPILTLLPNLYVDDERVHRIRDEVLQATQLRIQESFQSLAKEFDEAMHLRPLPISLSDKFDVAKYENFGPKPPQILFHENFPVQSLEKYRIKGKITDKMGRRITKIMQIDDTDLYSAYLRYANNKEASGTPSAKTRPPRQLSIARF